MLRWAVVFLLIALVAGALGFFGLAGDAMWFRECSSLSSSCCSSCRW